LKNASPSQTDFRQSFRQALLVSTDIPEYSPSRRLPTLTSSRPAGREPRRERAGARDDALRDRALDAGKAYRPAPSAGHRDTEWCDERRHRAGQALVRDRRRRRSHRHPEPLRELIHPEFEFAPHITGGHEGVEFHGYDGFVSFVSVQAETWESLHAEPLEMRERGDVVVVLGTLRARGRGSGVEVEEPTVWLCRCRCGRMLRLEAHAARDSAQVVWALAQAGLPPDAFDAPGESGEAASSSD
jgi:hypothetical protein